MAILRTLRLNREFDRVYRRGRFYTGRHVVLHVLPRASQPCSRIGVTASRKIKGSVRRNRVKRLLRAGCQVFWPAMPAGYDLIAVGRHWDKELGLAEIAPELLSLIRRAGIRLDPNLVEPCGEQSPAKSNDQLSDRDGDRR